jgi:hypothetical protein
VTPFPIFFFSNSCLSSIGKPTSEGQAL